MKTKELKSQLCCILVLSLSLLCTACSAEKKAEEIFEIASFEELQTNIPHAKELYEQIIAEYPDTETAKKAQSALERLSGNGEHISP